MSRKNRTSPEKIGPLVHSDMSGKYETGLNLTTPRCASFKHISALSMYNSELWSMTVTLEQHIKAFHCKQLRFALGIYWPRTISNDKTLWNHQSRALEQSHQTQTPKLVRPSHASTTRNTYTSLLKRSITSNKTTHWTSKNHLAELHLQGLRSSINIYQKSKHQSQTHLTGSDI